jgi:anti-sigma B factor antagonist
VWQRDEVQALSWRLSRRAPPGNIMRRHELVILATDEELSAENLCMRTGRIVFRQDNPLLASGTVVLNVADQPFDVERTNSETKLTIRGVLDINSAPLLAEAIDRVVATKPPKVMVDLSALDLIDSSGVAALVKLYRGVRGHRGSIVISGARDQPLAIFKLLRMDRVFNL